MQKIIDGKKYDTETAEFILEYHWNDTRSGAEYYGDVALYKTKSGRAFLHKTSYCGNGTIERLKDPWNDGKQERITSDPEEIRKLAEKLDGPEQEMVYKTFNLKVKDA